MSSIYWPKVIMLGVVGYMGFLYVSSVIDKRKQKPSVNIVNLAHMIPTLDNQNITKQNVLTLRQNFYRQIAQFQNTICDLCSQRQQIFQDLKQKAKQNPPPQNKNKSNNQQQQYAEHIKINYVQRNKILFEQDYLYGLVSIPKKLDLQGQCNRLMYTDEGMAYCYKKTAACENRIRNYLYRNEIGNTVK